MKLSLSVRIAEGFLSKEEALMDLPALAGLAKTAGYDGLCMRASQVGIHSPPSRIREAAGLLTELGLSVSMVTGDFDIVYNNEKGPSCLRRIEPYLDLAHSLGSTLLRVALKHRDDILWAQRAADCAAERGLRLAHQCHVQSLFETVEGIVSVLSEIGRPNFGLIYEPANLQLCGQDYGKATLGRVAPWLFNVYLQNQRLHPEGSTTLETWSRGSVRFDILDISAPGGLDFGEIIADLRHHGYDGSVTVHQSAPPHGDSAGTATKAAAFLKRLVQG